MGGWVDGGGGEGGGGSGGGVGSQPVAATEVAKLSVLLLCSRNGYQHLVFAYRSLSSPSN